MAKQLPTKKQKLVSKKEDKPNKGLVAQVEDDLESIGVYTYSNRNVAKDYLVMPSDVTEIENSELGKYFTAFTNQKLYVRNLVCQSGMMVRELNYQLDTIRARVYSTLPAKMSVKEKELTLLNDPKAEELISHINFLQEKYNMLSMHLDNLVDAITCISREITRRENDMFAQNRENNISKRR